MANQASDSGIVLRGTGDLLVKLDTADLQALAIALEPYVTRLQKAPPDPPPPVRRDPAPDPRGAA